MSDVSHVEPPTDPTSPGPERKGKPVRVRAGLGCGTLLVAWMIAGMAPWALPLDACFPATLAAIFVVTGDVMLSRMQWYERKLTICRLTLAVVTVIGSFGIGILLGIGQEKTAFREVFGKSPPSGVNELSGQRGYTGMLDRDDILLRFVVDEPTLQALMSKGFVRDDEYLPLYKSGRMTWAQFCDQAMWHPSGKYGAFTPSEALADPVVYTHQEKTSEPGFPDIIVLWDRTTGRTYVHRCGR